MQFYHDWYHHVLEELKIYAEANGVDLDEKTPLEFSISYSQGDGARVQGEITLAAIREHDPEAYAARAAGYPPPSFFAALPSFRDYIADSTRAALDAIHPETEAVFYVRARSHHYHHENTLTSDHEIHEGDREDDALYRLCDDLEEAFLEWMQELSRAAYRFLEKESEYLESEEHILADIEARYDDPSVFDRNGNFIAHLETDMPEAHAMKKELDEISRAAEQYHAAGPTAKEEI